MQSLASITLPESVTVIQFETFRNCKFLASITIPESVTAIGGYAFFDCDSLASITIPQSVTAIGDFAFEGCSSLESITIPESLRKDAWRAFDGKLQVKRRKVWIWLFVAQLLQLGLFNFEPASMRQYGLSEQSVLFCNCYSSSNQIPFANALSVAQPLNRTRATKRANRTARQGGLADASNHHSYFSCFDRYHPLKFSKWWDFSPIESRWNYEWSF